MVLSFPFRPTSSPRLSSVCLLELVPRPRAWDVLADDRSAAAGWMSVCSLLIMPCRFLAYARSLLLLGSSCGAVPIATCRAILSWLLDCFFLIKAFQ